MKLEVRCCCQPRKLLGWLEVADDYRHSATFVIGPDTIERIDVSEISNDWRSSVVGRVIPGDSITLAIAEIGLVENGVTARYRALKADGVPIERLRLIPGFEEAAR